MIFKKKKAENANQSPANVVTIKVEGMMCPHCSGRVKTALEACEKVASADVSHERKNAIVTLKYTPDTETVNELVKIITEAGSRCITE